jgi:hypothetical protein
MMLLQLQRLYHLEYHAKMMNSEKDQEGISHGLFQDTIPEFTSIEENCEKYQSGLPAAQPRFKTM